MEVLVALFMMLGVATIGGAMQGTGWFNEAAAAWAQAFGTVAAVWMAVMIAFKEAGERAQDRRSHRDAAMKTLAVQIILTCSTITHTRDMAEQAGPGKNYPLALLPEVEHAIQQLRAVVVTDCRDLNAQIVHETMLALLLRTKRNLRLISHDGPVPADGHMAFMKDIRESAASALEVARNIRIRAALPDEYEDFLHV